MGGKNAKNRRFCKCLIANYFRFSYIFSTNQNDAFWLSLAASEAVRCGF
jgi:hypothetical protein